MDERRTGGACPEPDALLAAVEDGDAGTLEHVSTCPRCRALVAAWRDFVSPDPESFAPRQAEAEDALARFLAKEFEPGVARAPDRGWRAAVAGVLSSMTRRRVVWVATATVVLAVSVLVWLGGREHEPGGTLLRRGPSGSPVSGERVVTEPPRLRRDGAVELRWRPFEGAEAYQVVLLAPGTLAGVLRPKPVHDTRAVLNAAELRSVAGPEGLLLWQVMALAAGDTLARSRAAVLEVPAGP